MRLINQCVCIESCGDIAVVMADNPPVNALSHVVRAGLLEAIDIATADQSIRGIVFACKGRTFFAGADIAEFGKPTQGPNLSQLTQALDRCPKPTAAALFGTALGGGFEFALACHFRVSSREGRVGLPEVKLGILPGAGGTQRLPRLIGPERALHVIVSGDPIPADLAHDWRAIDVIAEDPVAGAIELLRAVLEEARPFTRVRDREQQLESARADPGGFDAAVLSETRKSAGADAPVACAESVRNAFLLPFDEAVEIERSLFKKLVAGEQSAALRYLFFAERRAAKSDDIPEVRPSRLEPPAAARELAGCTFRHDGLGRHAVADQVGLHSAGPLESARLLEVVRRTDTDPGLLGTVVSLVRQLRKVAVIVADSPGLVGPRMVARMLAESERLLADGLSRPDVEAIWLQLGFSAGPFALADAAGIDVVRHLQGLIGMAGPFHRVGGNCAADRSQRLLYPMVNEAAWILQEEIVQRAADIDVVCVHGYGWPAWRGGPCFFAHSAGIGRICCVLDDLAAATGDIGLAPAPLLRACASSGGKLAALSRQVTQSSTAAARPCATAG